MIFFRKGNDLFSLSKTYLVMKFITSNTISVKDFIINIHLVLYLYCHQLFHDNVINIKRRSINNKETVVCFVINLETCLLFVFCLYGNSPLQLMITTYIYKHRNSITLQCRVTHYCVIEYLMVTYLILHDISRN